MPHPKRVPALGSSLIALWSEVQMASLVEDFLHSPGIDPQVETHFRTFLSRQRVRCHQLHCSMNDYEAVYWSG